MVDHSRIESVDEAFDAATERFQQRLSVEERLDNIEGEMRATRQLIQHVSDTVLPTVNEILAAVAPLISQLETSTSPVARAIRMSLGIKGKQ